MQVGDKILILGVPATPASIVTIHEGGAVDAKIEQEGHPANGAVTHVAAGNFFNGTEEAAGIVTACSPKVEQLGAHTTVTRG